MKKLKPETKQKIIKTTIIAVVLILIALAIYLPLQLTGTLAKIDSAEKLKELILEFGAYSYIIFFIVQFLQTTFIPIPAAVTTVAGTLLFGPWITLGISFLAIMTGSLFSFFLGKKIGRKLVVWVAGEKTTLKWEEKLKKGKYVFFLMMLFPFFPDDILCILVGTINMSYRFFIITNLITRPISLIVICFLGSGQLIPFSGWGIPVWIVLVVLALIVLYLSFKFQPQIEKFVVNLGAKLTNKKQKTENQIYLLGYTEENKNNDSTINSNDTKEESNDKEDIPSEQDDKKDINANIDIENSKTDEEDKK